MDIGGFYMKMIEDLCPMFTMKKHYKNKRKI
jgi:hypothetical protein